MSNRWKAMYVQGSAVLFAIMVNSHFGWNMFPGSDAELIADGIVFLIYGMSFLIPSEKV